MGTFQSGQRCVSISAGDRRVCADQEDGTDEIKGSRGRGFEGSRIGKKENGDRKTEKLIGNGRSEESWK
jgi:hypothetical protein